MFIILKYNLIGNLLAKRKYRFLYYTYYIISYLCFCPTNITQEKKIRLAFENSGLILFKFGQLLSTRSDLLSKPLIKELEKMQDRAHNFCPIKLRYIIEHELNCSFDDVFMNFDLIPIASASVSQIHTASMKDNTEVIIKILRPGVLKESQLDILLMEKFIMCFKFLYSKKDHLLYIELINELKQNIQNETNFLIEGANMIKVKNNFYNSRNFYVPDIYWNFSTENVLFMEKINGIKINNIYKLQKFGFDLHFIGKKYVELFFTQVFRDKFFHADMHPGNILISIDSFDHPKIILIDFGVIGVITTKDQNYMAQNILGFINKDYQNIAKLHIMSGRISKKVKINDLEAAICSIWEPIINKHLNKINFQKIFVSLLKIAKKFGFQMQPQLLLFQKTLITVEGITRYVHPNINLWKTIKLILEKWVILNLILNNNIIKKLKNSVPFK